MLQYNDLRIIVDGMFDYNGFVEIAVSMGMLHDVLVSRRCVMFRNNNKKNEAQ